MVTALGAVLGLGLAAGTVLIFSGVTGPPRLARTATPGRDRRATWIRAGCAAGGALVGGLMTGWVVAAVAGGVAGWFGLRLVGAGRRSRRAGTDRIEALAVWAEMLRDGFTAGSHLATTVAATETVAPTAIRADVDRLCQRMRSSRTGAVHSALRRFADDIADPTADTIVVALLLAAQGKGTDMESLLSTLAGAARAEVNMRLEVEAKRAEIFLQRRLIVGVIVLFGGYLVVFRHGYLHPFTTPIGQVVVAVIFGVFAASLWLMDRFSRLDPPPRLMQPERLNP